MILLRHRIAALLLLALAAASPRPAPGADKPNIVLILADDMGFSDLSSYGSEIDTPNLDRLAANGLRYTQFYNVGRCAPTRASLLTGLYNHHAGVGHMVEDFGLPGYRGRLNPEAVTIGEALRPAGYRTIAVGKWHVGSPRGSWPLDRGFDRFYGSPQGDLHYFRMFGGRSLVLGDQVIEPGEDWFSTEAYTEQAIGFIREAQANSKPFFCYLAYYAPHYPLQARPQDIERHLGRYRQGWGPTGAARHRRQVERGVVESRWGSSPPDPRLVPDWATVDQEEMDRRMAVYAAQVEEMDRGVGRVVSLLEESGAIDNTLILFLSDNGGDSAGGPLGFRRSDRGDATAPIGSPDSYASFGAAWAHVANTPFRGYKGETYEGGVATPLIVHWPAGISERGGLRRQVGHVIDLLPTLLDAAGAAYPAERNGKPTLPLDGRSLVPTFQNRLMEREPLFWEHMGARAVRDGRWKLVSRPKGDWELYDLDSDRAESKDLAPERSELVRKLSSVYDAWAARTGVEPWQKVQPIFDKLREAQP
ncbi:MAG: sulfatase-like hydrolase/transferase [Acidobacteria bacterium]|nr:sulfatase-like hydrolase/transferase [Acidobacteriota bacterium]